LLAAAQLANKTFDAFITTTEAVSIDQILPNTHGIPAVAEIGLDHLPERLAGAGRRKQDWLFF
jgi:hypothetical protein